AASMLRSRETTLACRPLASTRNSPSIPALRAGALAGRLAPLLPLQRPLFPFVDEPHDQDGEENHHRPETEDADLGQHDRPWKEERNLEVEENEQDRNQIVADVELHPRVFDSLEAACVGGEFLGLGA